MPSSVCLSSVFFADVVVANHFFKSMLGRKICGQPIDSALTDVGITSPCFLLFRMKKYTGPPVLLEYEDGDIFLGFHVDLSRMEVRFFQPQASWQFLHNKSACCERALLSSLRSRAHMILRSSWPVERRDEDLRVLHSCYVEQGFSSSKVEKLLRRICVYRPLSHPDSGV